MFTDIADGTDVLFLVHTVYFNSSNVAKTHLDIFFLSRKRALMQINVVLHDNYNVSAFINCSH